MKVKVKILIEYDAKIYCIWPYIFCQGPKVQPTSTEYTFWATDQDFSFGCH